MQPMLPTLLDDIPTGANWVYEVKYDGFRALLHWTEGGVRLMSRNGNDLSERFPEVIREFSSQTSSVRESLPLLLDGEICILNTPFQSHFPLLQKRNRMRSEQSIAQAAEERPATFLAFDLLKEKGKSYTNSPYHERREMLEKWKRCVHVVDSYSNAREVQDLVFLHRGEGLVAKNKKSLYKPGERSNDWIKIKNWRTIQAFLTAYKSENGYFTASVYSGDTIVDIGSVKHGLSTEDQQTLQTFFTNKGEKSEGVYTLDPSVCVGIHCLHAQKDDLREPMFSSFLLELSPGDCTGDQAEWDLALFPHVDYTNTEKVLWKESHFKKRHLLLYLRKIAPYMLPFLKDKKLTVIRFPDGIDQESFFQKHLPDYAPDYVNRIEGSKETYMVCNDLNTILWHGNQGAIEYHIPFETSQASAPNEIVFDLDPPERESFSLAIKAATLLKMIFDRLNLKAFVKTSGGKGMQIHIPIQSGSLTYEETRLFTEHVAQLLISQEPDLFTVERLKKKRGNRLYIDYVQHAEGKTIVSPYSPRGREGASVATPLYWSEVNESLDPSDFHIGNVLERVETRGCPFASYQEVRETQDLQLVKELIEED
ncbi:bifunctional non-homologous end joining protein LigD [Pontibacillus salipaludis]|uniref:DNA ligase (ATP) n=2 Tax=Pontibacillus salipaludis TaxID=1697394 RepID=A0ABQ1PQJ9_9BACI|nr:bifunctional non-homologous end joining protein LigD [Pontibacillus salipaludis]